MSACVETVTQKLYDLDQVVTTSFEGWMYFETSDAYVRITSLICPCFREYRKIHLVCNDAVVTFGKSLSQSSKGAYEYRMNVIESKVYLRPLYLQLIFKDRKKTYTILFKYIEDYKFMIRSLKEQKKKKIIDKEEFLQRRICYLHRQNALYVTRQRELHCRKIYAAIREETNKVRPPTEKRRQNVYHLRWLAKKKCLCCPLCFLPFFLSCSC